MISNSPATAFRIRFIAPSSGPQFEMVHNTPLSCLMTVVGIACFFGGIGLLLTKGVPEWGIIIPVLGIVILLLGRRVAARDKYRAWFSAQGTCIDSEVALVNAGGGARSKPMYHFRVLCKFFWHGKEYTVTPCSALMSGFFSEAAAQAYLKEKIAGDGSCTIRFNPENPLDCFFDQTPAI